MVLLLIYALPSALALGLSFSARSRVARHLLRWPAIAALLMVGLSFALMIDCQQAEFTYYGCQRLPDVVGDMGGFTQVLFVVGFVTAGPLLLLAAAVAEFLARRH